MSQTRVAVKEGRLLEVFHRYGWMMLFWAACFLFYSHAMHKKSGVCSDLKGKIRELEGVKQQALYEREELALQIQSQGDPDWIEMVLKQRLGVVPDGQMKVYFKKEE